MPKFLGRFTPCDPIVRKLKRIFGGIRADTRTHAFQERGGGCRSGEILTVKYEIHQVRAMVARWLFDRLRGQGAVKNKMARVDEMVATRSLTFVGRFLHKNTI